MGPNHILLEAKTESIIQINYNECGLSIIQINYIECGLIIDASSAQWFQLSKSRISEKNVKI